MEFNAIKERFFTLAKVTMIAEEFIFLVQLSKNYLYLHKAKILYDNIRTFTKESDTRIFVCLSKPILSMIDSFTIECNTPDDAECLLTILSDKSIENVINTFEPRETATSKNLTPKSVYKTYMSDLAKQKRKNFISSSKGRFVLIGIAYIILFIIFAVRSLLFCWITLTIISAIGIIMFICDDYYKSSTFNKKTSSIEDKEKKKKNYSIIIAICLIFCIIVTLLCGTTSDSNSSSSKTCGICGGSGTVTTKMLGEGTGIKNGFDTYYRCKGCHGSGRS